MTHQRSPKRASNARLKQGFVALSLLTFLLTAPNDEAHAAALTETSTIQSAADNDLAYSAYENVRLAREHADKGELGGALAHLERARWLRPFDLELRQGVRSLNYQIQRARMERFNNARLTQGEPSKLWTWRLFHTLPSRAWAWLALGAVWLTCGLYLVRRTVAQSLRRDALSIALSFSALGVLTSALCWIGSVFSSSSLTPGVLVGAPVTQVWSAPDPLVTPTLNPDAYDGAVVLVHTQDGEWTEVQLADDERVWVRSSDVIPIAPQR